MEALKMLIELAVFAVGIYLVLRFLRETRGSGVVRGLIIVLLGGLIAFLTLIDSMGLERLGLVFEEVTATIVLALVIVFHQEIRRAFVQLGDSQIFGGFFRREVKTIQRLLRSVARLSKERVGALIAIEREGSLANLAETGVHIDAELNSFLIESIFYPGSALHDGAIVVRGDRLVAASCLLPLSQNQDLDKRLGTRHRAALGLTEESDALAIVVSEETGKISTSVGGKLDYGVDLEQLEKAIIEHQRGRASSSSPKERRSSSTVAKAIFADPYRKLIAVGLALTLWLYLDRQVTDEAKITPQLAMAPSSTGDNGALELGKNTLSVVLSDWHYSIAGFSNTVGAISSVDITLMGTNSKLSEFGTELRGLRVELDTKEMSDEAQTLEFRLDDVMVRPPGLKDLLSSMQPPTVRVNLIRNVERTVSLTHSMVTWPDESKLVSDQAQFAFTSVRLRGPESELNSYLAAGSRPFLATLSPPSGSPGPRRGDLRLAPSVADDDITMDPDLVSLTVPEKPEFKEFVMTLRVFCNDTKLSDSQRASLSLPETVEVNFQAAGSLDARLRGEGPESLWLWENAYVMVIPEPDNLADGSPIPGRLVFVDSAQYREGSDYQVETPFVEVKIKD